MRSSVLTFDRLRPPPIPLDIGEGEFFFVLGCTIYARIGYQEYDRRDVGGRDAVFMRKTLGAAVRGAEEA